MKVIDTRDNRIFTGELVAILSANEEPSDEDIMKYYRVSPGSKHYNFIKRPCALPRMVLLRETDEGDEPVYYIIPRYSFYQELKETV